MAKHFNLLGEDLIQFEDFKVCDDNIQAYCTCTLIARGEDIEFDPFLIYGEEGSGKTHLLRETAETLAEIQNVYFTNGREFALSLTKAVSSGSLRSFRHEYLSADYVLIDDIDQIDNADAEEELLKILVFHKAVLLTANNEPSNLPFSNGRLKAKLQGCTEIEIQAFKDS